MHPELLGITSSSLDSNCDYARLQHGACESDIEFWNVCQEVLAGLVRRYVRKHIAASINMRLCPEIRFIQDDSIQRGEEVCQLHHKSCLKSMDAMAIFANSPTSMVTVGACTSSMGACTGC